MSDGVSDTGQLDGCIRAGKGRKSEPLYSESQNIEAWESIVSRDVMHHPAVTTV
jgi:hypothetical protein